MDKTFSKVLVFSTFQIKNGPSLQNCFIFHINQFEEGLTIFGRNFEILVIVEGERVES